jgi:hypothetical protein
MTPALLSHAAKIPGTESYHPDRSEVGFGLGYRAIYRLALRTGRTTAAGPHPIPPARFSRRVGLGYAQGAGFRTGRAMAAGARSQPMSSNRDIRRPRVRGRIARRRARHLRRYELGGGRTDSPQSGVCPLGKPIDGLVAQPESNLGSVGVVGFRP